MVALGINLLGGVALATGIPNTFCFVSRVAVASPHGGPQHRWLGSIYCRAHVMGDHSYQRVGIPYLRGLLGHWSTKLLVGSTNRVQLVDPKRTFAPNTVYQLDLAFVAA